MTEFNLFNIALSKYNQNNPKDDINKNIIYTSTICSHTNIIDENDTVLCLDCGEEISKNISYEKEWRYYGSTDNKNMSDPNRVQMRKNDDRNIYKDVEKMGFSAKIVSMANEIYTQVTKRQIKRGNSRKSIIFACIFQSCKINGYPQSHEKLIKIFELSRKTGLNGLKHVALNAPKNSPIHTTYITPIHLIKDIMDQFSASVIHKEEVIELYNKIRNKDTRLNRARPLSTASGVLFHYITSKKKDISLKEFAKVVKLSELTIGRMAKLIANILENI